MKASTHNLMVNTQRLVQIAREEGWEENATRILWSIAGTADFCPESALETVPELLPYDHVAPRMHGTDRLAVIEALVVDVCHPNEPAVRLIGGVLLGMARHLFLPLITPGGPAHAETLRLLEAFERWTEGGPAEDYVGEAYRYRRRCIRLASCMHLPAIMPAEGLCCALGEGRWQLANHWRAYWRYVASGSEAWLRLNDVVERIDETVFVLDADGSIDAERDAMATQAAHEMVHELREEYVSELIDEHDEVLGELLGELLPALCGSLAKHA